MPKITAATRLSELQAIARGTRAVDPLVSPQMVRSIQQSMRVEGYPVTARTVRAAVRRVFREPLPRS